MSHDIRYMAAVAARQIMDAFDGKLDTGIPMKEFIIETIEEAIHGHIREGEESMDDGTGI